MSRIIAGEFSTQAEAETAQEALRAAGFGESDISIFFNNAPGQHGELPTGGDERADPQARDAGKGAVTGAAIGAGLGLAALTAGPAGLAVAGVAAYVGSLAGTARAMEDQPGGALQRPAGVIVAVNASAEGREADAIRVLRDQDADNLERADGVWENGDWADFDPVSAPQLVDQHQLHTPGNQS